MPGYPKERFVGLTQSDSDELMCGICLDILRKPKVVSCCLQTYCSDCINQWLNQNNTCPNDRQNTRIDQLNDPPLIVNNLIMKLKIKCDFVNNGCNSVQAVEYLEKHLISCEYKPKINCENCGLIFNKSHDCVSELIKQNTSLKKRVDQLEKQNNLENFKALYDDHREAVKKSALKNIQKSEPTQILQRNGFGPNMERKLIEIIYGALLQTSDYEEIAKNVYDGLYDTKWSNLQWQVIVTPKDMGSSCVNSKQHYIDICIGELKFEVFSTGRI